MSDQLTELDVFLLDRWPDTMGIREAIKELEDRLGDRLEAVAERLGPWLTARGYEVAGVETKYAAVNIVKKGWMKNRDEAFIYVAIAGLFPFGYRRVDEEHPYVWLRSEELTEAEEQVFQAEMSSRLKDTPGGWLNEYCTQSDPVGRYIVSYGDPERARLAQSDESLEQFIKAELEPILALGDGFDAALKTARGAKTPGVKA